MTVHLYDQLVGISIEVICGNHAIRQTGMIIRFYTYMCTGATLATKGSFNCSKAANHSDII